MSIYLDHAATTPLDPRVFEVMVPYLKEHYGNASSLHKMGRKARFAVEESRERISALLGVTPGEVIFTSGGTEANNAALKGVQQKRRGAILSSPLEHEAILTPLEGMHAAGVKTNLLSPSASGAITLADLKAALEKEAGQVSVVSLMHANNETGVLNPVVELGDYCADQDILFHTDAVQSAGWFNWQSAIEHADLISISAHKFYGPKGIGCLVATRNAELDGLIVGGSQERRRRGGTENVAGIVGFATALELADREREERVAHLEQLQHQLWKELEEELPKDTYQFTTPTDAANRAPHIVNLAFPPVDGKQLDGEMLILNLDMEGVMASSGSACTSGTLEPSHVLLALGLNEQTASAAVRFSLGKDNTPADVTTAVDKLAGILKRMRGNV